jgi:hypothetical protein
VTVLDRLVNSVASSHFTEQNLEAHPAGLVLADGQAEAKPVLDILQFSMPKETLAKMTTEERSLFLLVGYASNQVNLHGSWSSSLQIRHQITQLSKVFQARKHRF